MEKNKKEQASQQSPTPAQTILVSSATEKEQKVICDVCGYANPENTAICKKCSNYL